ncbi:PTS sugar transporter subunit IIA [Arcanobacterium pinnipediorum]|uniref:PTS glucose transporter subunit IIA n=1 Tax=Arcanobacterium pinnipediorum TaxID=1503041 RepID=A0ABY5AG97_9ACTO|nr:PTS glucose transporter subunit IIA [Arcanobacterium pinnipediorum]USR79218.1 PTS glucose transporter subunit IIA [Arcanobacterium pinnipediorum]
MFGLGKKKVEFHPVFAGRVVPVTEVPDPVFAQGMLGDGYAVIPDENADELVVCAPVDGEVAKLFKTLHAFTMHVESGVDLLVHIGLDTVDMRGEGFTALVEKGQAVKAGTPIMRLDAKALRASGKNLITPVVFTEKVQVKSVVVHEGEAGLDAVAATVTLA